MAQTDRALRSNLRLRHLQLLVALDQFRHLGRASEFLALTQPAVSKMLAEVERMYGLPLFTRSTRGTEPTAAGATVVRFARSVLADHARTQDEIVAAASGAAGRVAVGAMVAATPGLLLRAVRRMKAASPQATVSIEEGDLTRLLPRLRTGELDLFVGRLEPGYAAPDLHTEPLYEDAMCLVCHPEHALARRQRVHWADLVGEPWVMPPPWATSRVKLHQMFYRHRLDPPTDVVETASFLNTLALVRQRPAIGFLAQSVARYGVQEGWVSIIPIQVPIDLPPVGIITMRDRSIAPTTGRLLEALRATTAEDAGDLGVRPWRQGARARAASS